MGIETLTVLGVVITKLLFRALDLGGMTGANSIAEAVGDTAEGIRALRGLLRRHDARDEVAKTIADSLRVRLALAENQEMSSDLQAATLDVAGLLDRLSNDDQAILAAAESPEALVLYARHHGGDDLARWTSIAATPYLYDVLTAACHELAKLAPTSPRFLPAALVRLLSQVALLPGIDANIRNLVHAVSVLPDIQDNIHYTRQAIEQLFGDSAIEEASLHAPRVGMTIDQWSPDRLGIHRTIEAGGATGLTPYIVREHDAPLRAALQELKPATAIQSRLIVLKGTSCAGKTRTIYEAVRSTLEDWPLIAPNDAGELAHFLRSGIPARTIVWLDELQRFLTLTPQGVACARDILTLLRSERVGPVLFLGTIWPENLVSISSRPTADTALTGATSLYDLMGRTLTDRHYVPDHFSEREILFSYFEDPRLAIALRTAAEGRITQVLAGGAQLVERLHPSKPGASDFEFTPTARAILLAAADLRRVGYANRLPRWLLERVAGGYLEGVDRSLLDPAKWFQDALEEVEGNVSRTDSPGRRNSHDNYTLGVPALTPHWITSDGKVEELYELHDFLLQDHLIRRGQLSTQLELWTTLTSHIKELSSNIALSIGWNAERRGLYSAAITMYRPSANSGDWGAQHAIARAAAESRDVEVLVERADRGEWLAQTRLAEQAAARQDLELLLKRSNAGDQPSRILLVNVAVENDDVDVLVASAEGGNASARYFLALLAAQRGDAATLRAQADSGYEPSRNLLAKVLAERRDVEALVQRASDGDSHSQEWLAILLKRLGDKERLTLRADAGDQYAQEHLAELLAWAGDVGTLAARAKDGDWFSARALAGLEGEAGRANTIQAFGARGPLPPIVVSRRGTDSNRPDGASDIAVAFAQYMEARSVDLPWHAVRRSVRQEDQAHEDWDSYDEFSLVFAVHAARVGAASALIKRYRSRYRWSGILELDTEAAPVFRRINETS